MKFMQVDEELRKFAKGATEKFEKLKGKDVVGHSQDD
jgi:hypothetical protein